MIIAWYENAWEDYVDWQKRDRAKWRRINQLITDICRNGHEGIGKPEPLKYEDRGLWSRRINEEHRLVYDISGDTIRVWACRYHYQN